MTTFKHKTLPIKISYSEYSKLSSTEQNNFIIVNETTKTVTNNITTTNTNINSETTDLLGIGKAVETVVLTPVAIGLGILDRLF